MNLPHSSQGGFRLPRRLDSPHAWSHAGQVLRITTKARGKTSKNIWQVSLVQNTWQGVWLGGKSMASAGRMSRPPPFVHWRAPWVSGYAEKKKKPSWEQSLPSWKIQAVDGRLPVLCNFLRRRRGQQCRPHLRCQTFASGLASEGKRQGPVACHCASVGAAHKAFGWTCGAVPGGQRRQAVATTIQPDGADPFARREKNGNMGNAPASLRMAGGKC